MQPLSAPPRDHLTADQVRTLLTAPEVTYAAGLELLNNSNTVLEDISDDLATAPVVSWDNRNAVHGRVRLAIQRELVWGRDRLRPYMLVTSGDTIARFNAGVYVPTTPDTQLGEDPVTYEVTGYDLLSLLQSTGPGDTWVTPSGDTYFQAIRDILDASGLGAVLLLDGTAQDTTLPATRVWALATQPSSWLRMITDLLNEIGYTRPWADENGAIRARPFVDTPERPAEWVLNTGDPNTNLVGENRTLSVEAGDIPNWWRFVRTNMDTTPTEGDGIHTIENLTDGPTSQTELGRVITKVEFLEAADQAALVAQATKIVAEDKAAVRTITLEVDPLPIMGFDDVFQYLDAGHNTKAAAASWELHLDGSPGTLQLGGPPAEPLDTIEAQAKGTVTDDAPLSVVVDGATVSSFANALDGATYDLGDRVTVTIRNPLPPLVQGVES